MNKAKRILGVVLTIAIGIIATLTLVACKHEHKFNEWQCLSPDDTFCEEREYEQKCSCGEVQSKKGSKYDHDAGDDGKCVNCDRIVATAGLRYELSESGESYALVGFDGDNENVVIPRKHNGVVVTTINTNAFYYNSTVKNIDLPDTIENFEATAFAFCFNLVCITVDENNANYKSIDGNLYSKDGNTFIQYAVGKAGSTFNIPDGVEVIGINAFSKSINLINVEMPDSVTAIGHYAFFNSGLSSVIIPDSVMELGDYAFAYCNNLTSVTVGRGVTSFGECVFIDCANLTSVVIKDGVSNVGDFAFKGCGITRIEIPESVSNIGQYAFADCSYLTEAVIKNTGDIRLFAFSSCINLERIVMGKDITRIVLGAFDDCPITNIYFCGTIDEWNNFLLERDISEDFRLAVTYAIAYFYSETEPTEIGPHWHYDDNGEIVVWRNY